MSFTWYNKQWNLFCCPKKCLPLLPCFGSIFPAKLVSQIVLNFTYKFKSWTGWTINWRFWNKYCFLCVHFKNNVDFSEIFRLEVCQRVLSVLPGKFRSFQNSKWKSFWSLKVKTMRSMIFPRPWPWRSFGTKWRLPQEWTKNTKIFISVERSSMMIATCATTK